MITCIFDDGGKGNLRHVCVDALVIVDDKILLAKRSNKVSTEAGKYCIPGGYFERDEYLIETAIRETKEETGYHVSDGLLFHIRDAPVDISDVNRQNVAFTYLFTSISSQIEPHTDWDSDKPIWMDLLETRHHKSEIAFDHWNIIQAYVQHKAKPRPLPIWNACLSHYELSS